MTQAEEKLEDIEDGLQTQLNQLCGCGFALQHITAGELQCFDSSTEVTYRARISGTSTNSSSDILAYLEEWIRSGTASVVDQKFRLVLDSSCLPVAIDSFSDPKCEGSPSDEQGSDNTTAIIGGVVAVVVVIALTLIIVIACLVVRSRRRAAFSLHKGER